MAIYGFRIRPLGNTCYYTSDEDLGIGDYALLDAEHGQTLAKIVSGPLKVLPGIDEKDLPQILRRANCDDMEILARNEVLQKQTVAFCKRCIEARNLDMKLVDVEVFFDRSKLIFYFTAPNRIDFRDLVKDLVREFRSRIELRQIGMRHEIQMVGAIGSCGQVCCCRQYVRKFAPVTIKMAKEQNLFLNPSKISGICGRLLCCLSFEEENYEQFHRDSPRPGKKYQTNKGIIKVLRSNMFKNSVSAVLENNEDLEFSLEEWNALKPQRLSFEQVQDVDECRQNSVDDGEIWQDEDLIQADINDEHDLTN